MSGFFRRNGLFAAIEIGGRLPLFVTLGLLASSVGPETYGAWSLVLVAAMVLSAVSALGLGSSISRIAAGADPEGARGLLAYSLGLAMLVALALSGLVALFHDPVAETLGVREGDRDLVMLTGPLVIAMTLEALLDAYFKARERVRHQAILVLGRTAIEVSVVVVVFATSWVRDDPETQLTAYVLATAGIKLAFLYPWLLLAGGGARKRPNRAARRAFVGYGIPLIPTMLVVWLTTQGDRLVLGHTVSPEELGWYGFGAMLAWNLSYLSLAIYPLLLPRASVLFDRGEHDEVNRLFNASQRVYLALFSGAMVAIALLAEDIIRLLAGEAFAPAAGVFLLLCLVVGLEGILGIYQWVFHLVRRTSLILAFNLFYMALQLGVVYAVATSTGDIEAVAVAAVAVALLANLLRYAVARSLYVVRITPVLVLHLAVLGGMLLAAVELGRDLSLGLRIAAAGAAALAGMAMAMHGARAAEGAR